MLFHTNSCLEKTWIFKYITWANIENGKTQGPEKSLQEPLFYCKEVCSLNCLNYLELLSRSHSDPHLPIESVVKGRNNTRCPIDPSRFAVEVILGPWSWSRIRLIGLSGFKYNLEIKLSALKHTATTTKSGRGKSSKIHFWYILKKHCFSLNQVLWVFSKSPKVCTKYQEAIFFGLIVGLVRFGIFNCRRTAGPFWIFPW